jgi:hypothetical protein
MDKVRREANISVNTSLRQYTIKNLKPNTSYFVSVAYEAQGKGYTTHNFQTNYARTTGGSPETATLLGTTGTTATVNLTDAIERVASELVPSGDYYYYFDGNAGYADQSIGKDKALKSAKEIVGKEFNPLGYKQGMYTMRGLKPGHKYTFVAGVDLTVVRKSDRKYYSRFVYITLPDIATRKTDDSDIYKAKESVTRHDYREDSRRKGRTIVPIKMGLCGMSFSSTCTENSITIDWSNEKGLEAVRNGLKEKDIVLSCVEAENYDHYAEKQKYGPVQNYGPAVIKAADKIDAHQYTIPISKTSFTFNNLKPATRYIVMVKCSYKCPPWEGSNIYAYDNVGTTGSKTDQEIKTQITQEFKYGYLYDATVKHDGKEAYLDWTGALNSFMGRSVFDDHYLRPLVSQFTDIGYAKLPEKYSKADVDKAYKEAERMIRECDPTAYQVEASLTNIKIYGLDPNAKYVFAISVPVTWYQYGNFHSKDAMIYADETGINFVKAKETGAQYDGHDIDMKPGGGSGSGNSGESGSGNSGGSGSSNSGESGSGKSGGSGSSNSGEIGSGKSGGSGSSNSGESTTTPSPGAAEAGSSEGNSDSSSNGSSNAAGYGSTSESQIKTAEMPQNDFAQIICSTDKISHKKLKKKAKTVTINVENSKGAITVKDVSSKKNKNVAEVKVKERKVKVKFKKGTAKGVYKFKVTVGAYGETKKTTETIKIRVK